MSERTYILGGTQSNFTRDMYVEGKTVFDLFSETLEEAFNETKIDPAEVQRGHIGNASGDVLTQYAQMGGFFSMANEKLAGMPASRHEAACCSGSMAMFGAIADIGAGFYDLVCVSGVETMGVDALNVEDFATADQAISAHAWPSERGQDEWVWPYLFSQFQNDYEERYGVDYSHLAAISRINMNNAKLNPNAKGQNYPFTEACFEENDDVNAIVMSGLRVHDVCRFADGAAVLFLASEDYARKYADKRGLKFEDIPWVKSFAHSTMPTELAVKKRLNQKSNSPYYMPHLNKSIEAAVSRAGFGNIRELDTMELHDCFSITEYMILDHAGFAAPGEVWRVIEDGTIDKNGSFPVNPSGGLIGGGHPIGCTGVRMALDSYKQVTGKAGDYQVEGANNAIMVNVGGTLTTVAAMVIGV